MKNIFRTLSIALFIGLVFIPVSQPAHGVLIDMVTVGNPGNAADQNYGDGTFGSVADTYRIGKYEVTNSQYTEFLNAVAATDTHFLYNSNMTSDLRGGITRSGSSGGYTYTVKTNFGNKPVNFVGFWDAARFTNWLHNGQLTGPQDNGTTEDGAYSLGGVTHPTNASISRNSGAKWFLPTEDQWYKAAYHQPATDGGDSDDYWLYATGSNTAPTVATASSSSGDISNPGANVANYNLGAFWNSIVGNVTTVGSAGPSSESYYGTSDQTGNVWEWNEAIISPFRGLRSGTFVSTSAFAVSASNRFNALPSGVELNVGFRVASPLSEPDNPGVPEPSTLTLAALSFLALSRRRRRK